MNVTFNKISQLTGAGSGGNYLNGATDVCIVGNYAFVTGFYDDSLVIIDITTKSSPIRVGQLLSGISGASGVNVVGNYAYVTGYYGNVFAIIDVSNKTSPSKISEVQGTINHMGGANRSFIDGDYAYVVALSSWPSGGFSIIDISNKYSPSVVGAIGGFSSPRDVWVDGNYAYVANSTNSTVKIVDVTNKTSPVIVGTCSHSSLSGYPYSVHVSGNYLYILTNTTSDSAVVVFDITSKTSPSYVGHLTSSQFNGGWTTFYTDNYGHYVFNAAFVDDRITAVNVKYPSSPSIVTSISGAGNYLNEVTGVFYDEPYLYAASRVSDAFVIIEVIPGIPDIPTNVAVIPGFVKNTISWDDVEFEDYYNLYWMKYEFFADEFSSLDLWNQYKDVGTETIEINSNRLRFSNSSGTGCHVVNKNEIPSGDFDIEIELSTYTPDDNSNGHKVILRSIDVYPYTDVDGVEVYYYVSNSGVTHNIVSNIRINSVLYNTATTSGGQPTKLRITRVGNVLTAYYYYSSWVSIDNRDFSSRSANVVVATLDSLQTSGNGGLTELDNFDFYIDLINQGAKITPVSSPYEHTSLDAEDNYIYIVTAENGAGESDESIIVNGVPETDLPVTPILSGEGEDSQNILTISNITGATSFDLYYGLTSGVTKITGIKIEDVSNPYYHIDLIRQNYYYIVISNNVSGESPPSNELCLKPNFEGKIFNHTEQIKESLLYQYRGRE